MLTFLLGGIETVSISSAFLIRLLALHPEVQDKLVREIEESGNNGQLDFDAVNKLPYLNMVVSEVLRLWASSVMDRVCTKDYNLGRPNKNATEDYIVRKGEIIKVCMRSIALDPAYFPDPHKFDPERFSEENKAKIPAGCFYPFGMGPRICIGSRFALIDLKIMAVVLLQNIIILPCKKTTAEVQFSKVSFVLDSKDGHWVRLQLRK